MIFFLIKRKVILHSLSYYYQDELKAFDIWISSRTSVGGFAFCFGGRCCYHRIWILAIGLGGHLGSGRDSGNLSGWTGISLISRGVRGRHPLVEIIIIRV
jgi:hypothetical protein